VPANPIGRLQVRGFHGPALKPGWSEPSTILFASEFPPNEKAFSFALAQALEFGADLIIFHVYDSSDLVTTQASGIGFHDLAAARAQKRRFEPLAQRADNLNIHCRIVVRPGLPAEQILAFMRTRKIDRVVMGTHSPGPIGKLLVGSVAEAVLRNSIVPVCIVGPNVVENSYRNIVTRKVLCDVSKQEASRLVANFGAELAARHHASLILHQVIPPQERAKVLGDRTIDDIEAELPSLVPAKLKQKITVRTRVALGDPTAELLYQGRAQHANIIVLGACGASHFASITRAGIVYTVLAYAHCPVITLSPIMLAQLGASENRVPLSEVNIIAGVF
jgi:nucleotide-binding universal stress UspA family protein